MGHQPKWKSQNYKILEGGENGVNKNFFGTHRNVIKKQRKINNLCILMNTVKEMKRQITELEKILVIYISER